MPILRFAGVSLLVLSVAALSCQTMAGDPASASRFRLIFNGAAVKDNQTGLLWEREPGHGSEIHYASYLVRVG